MSQIERNVIALMTTQAGFAEIVKAELGEAVFEEPVYRAAFNMAMEYWSTNQKVPTAEVITAEFPGIKVPDPDDVEEGLAWLIERLQRRFVTNQLQDVLRDAASTSVRDPFGSLRQLIENATHALAQAGNPGDGAPKLWAARDLRPAAQPRWLARNRLPYGAVSLLVGDEGIGKSLFWVYVAAAVTTGKPLPEFGIPARDPASVVVGITEDDWSTTVLPRLKVAGADLDLVNVICAEDDGSGAPDFPRDIRLIAGAEPAPALVVVDAWLDTVPAKLSVKDPQQARQALHPWKEVVTTTGAAVMLVSHTNRVSSSQARDKYGATGELRKKARMTLFAQRADNGYLIIGPEKANGASPVAASAFEIRGVPYFSATDDHDGTVPLLVYIGDSDHTAQEHVAQAYTAGHGASARDEAVAWLAGHLAQGPQWCADLFEAAREAGFSQDQAKRAKGKLKVASIRNGAAGAWFWRLPTQQGLPKDSQEGAEKSA